MASSRVGVMTNARSISPRASLSIMGKPKAAVFPVPVCACPTKSLPLAIIGIASSCIGLGSLKPAIFTPFAISR